VKHPGVGRPAEARRRANRTGRRAEWVAALLLTLKGYRIIARGFTVTGGEIDIVARRGSVLVFVEVKARPGLDEALLAVDGVKRRRVARAAAVWLARNPWAASLDFRGNAVLMAPKHWPRHVIDAFPVEIGW
jgi:putative endonuclease